MMIYSTIIIIIMIIIYIYNIMSMINLKDILFQT